MLRREQSRLPGKRKETMLNRNMRNKMCIRDRSPSTGQNTKATVCSYGDELTFTFSSLLKDTSVQKVFFRSLAEDGIDVEIETNGVYYD